MKRIVALSCVAVLSSGCAAAMQGGAGFGPRAAPTLAPQSAPAQLGNPAPSSGVPATPSLTPSGKRSGSGPVLGQPEAQSDDPRLRASSRPQAPAPKSRTSNYRSTLSLDAISAGNRPALLEDPVWSRYYRSTDRRAIETATLGKGAQHIAVIGSLHGDETQSVALVEELGRHLQRHPEALTQRSVLLIKSPNPDGVAARSPYNSRGVDLNRNFPSANWQALPSHRGGDRAGSEVETRIVLRLLEDFRPELIIHLKDARASAIVNSEGPITERAELVAERGGCRAVKDLGRATTGSLENYADTRLQCPSLTLLLPREPNGPAAWTKHRDALLIAIAPSQARQLTSSRPATSTDPFEALPAPAARPASTKSSRKTADFPAPVPAHGYLELPPP